MKYFHIIFIVQFPLAFSLHLEESVLENGRSGTDVVLLSIAYIHQVAIFQDDNSLLRRIAFVETKDGSNLDAFNQGNSGGIWAVDEDTFLSMQINSNSNTTLFQKYEEIRHLFDIDWKAVQWSELKKPIYSALAARLVLFIAPEDIPSSDAVPAQAQFWRDHYNGDSSVKDFIRAANEIQGDANEEETADFVVGFSKNFDSEALQRLFITTEEPDPVSFSVETLHGFNYNGTVSHSLASVISLGHTYQVNSSNDRSKGIKIFAGSKKIKVYGENYNMYTTDTFLALPCTRQNVREYVYYGMTYHDGGDRLSQLLIIGCEDNTTVTVASQKVTLNMMETYLYERDQDLTGTRVVSNNPISLFSGHQCTYVPENEIACDHLTEQLPNTATWGTHFLTASLAGRNTDDMYRILASQPSTIVTVTCSTQLQSNIYNLPSAGDWETIVIPGGNSSYCAIESNNPLLLVQFSLGYCFDSIIGDPFMMIVPAIEQYSNEVNIYITPNFSVNFITLYVAPAYYQPDMIYVDNISQENADWIAIYCADNAVCGYATYVNLSVGNHQIYHTCTLGKIGLSVYGFDRDNSYGYPGDLQLFPRHESKNIKFMQETYSVKEGKGQLTVSVERSRSTDECTVVLIATHPTKGTAIAEEDYSTVIKILEFISGSTYVDVNISIINDESVEGNETFTIYLTSDVGVNVSQTEVTIIDDDEEDDNNGDGDDDDSNYLDSA